MKKFIVGDRVVNTSTGEKATVVAHVGWCHPTATPVEYDIDDNGQVWFTPTEKLEKLGGDE